MKRLTTISAIFLAILTTLLTSTSLLLFAQSLDGVIHGIVRDSSDKKGIPRVTITAKLAQTGTTQTAESNSFGFYTFAHLWTGQYTLEAELKGYKRSVCSDVNVLSNQSVTVDFVLEKGELVATTSGLESQVILDNNGFSSSIQGILIADLPNFGQLGNASPYALSVFLPGVVSQNNTAIGEGGSMGGMRPSSNSFTLDGVDDNRLNVTGLSLPAIAESVAEMNVQPSSLTADYGQSASGLLNVVTKSGTNKVHGSVFGVGSNRAMNAMDNQEKQDLANGLIDKRRRYDFFRGVGTVGGPIIKDKLFGFAAYQYQSLGGEPLAYGGQSITNDGLATIKNDIKGLSSNNVSIIENQSIWPTALVPNGNYANVKGSDGVIYPVELGDVVGASSRFLTQRNWMTNVDYQSEFQQIHGRFQYSNQDVANLNPQSANPLYSGHDGLNQWRLNVTQIQPVKTHFIRETRLIFHRLDQVSNMPGSYSGTPNYSISSLGLFMGSATDSPQSRKENLIQLVNNFDWLKNRHNYKFGLEFRRWDAPTVFLPNSRGSYDWKSLESFLKDEIPTGIYGAYRGVGTTTFTDRRDGIYAFFQDEIRLLSKLQLSWGARYEFTGNPRDASLQADNLVASIPGKLDFRIPSSDKNNLAPKFAFAYDVWGDGKTSVRGGFGMNYDMLAGDYTRLSLPPQFQQVLTPALACTELDTQPNFCRNHSPVGPPNARGFLISGGLPSTSISPVTVKKARAATLGFIPDTVSPTVYSWSVGVQHEIHDNWLLEANYLGNRGQHLPVQNNRNPGVAMPTDRRLPTYFNASDIPSSASGAVSLADVLNYAGSGQRVLGSYGFTNDIIAYDPIGSSRYQGGSIYVQRRPSSGLFLRGGYTYSRALDNSSEALYGGAAGPARPEDDYNLRHEWGPSSLNRPHHFSLYWTYEVPQSSMIPALVKNVFAGWQFSGTFLLESGQPITPVSGYDVNNNLDASSDRVLINPNGNASLGTDTNIVIRDPQTGATSITSIAPTDSSQIVGYVAVNPTAKWVATRLGAQTDSGRNVLFTPRLNNWNIGVVKKFTVGENKYLQFRADLFNAFNHSQYILSTNPKYNWGTLNETLDYLKTLYSSYANPASVNFLNSVTLNSMGRVIQAGVKLTF